MPTNNVNRYKILPMDNSFGDWLVEEFSRKNWSSSSFARRAGIDTGNLSRVINGYRNPGPEMCRAIADALGYSEEYVFRKAGLLSPKKEYEKTVYERAGLERLVMLAEELAPYQVEEVIDYAAWRIEQDKKRGRRKDEG